MITRGAQRTLKFPLWNSCVSVWAFLKLYLLLFKGYLFQTESDGMIFFTSILNALQELQSVLISYICCAGLPNLCKNVPSFEMFDKDSFEGCSVPHTFITTEKLF